MQRLAVLNKHLILSRGFASGSMSAPRLVVIGGVAGGASVAARARRLAEHADITVLEKGPDVSFANCGMPYYIGNTITDPSKLHLHTPATLSTLLRLNVKAGTVATKIDRANKLVHTADVKSGKTSSLPYDKLVLSMGAFPLVPPLPGLADNPKVVTLRNLEDMNAIKAKVQNKQVKNIVVLGAGFIGIEMAEQLAEIGKTVTIVDKENGVLPLMDVDMTQMLVQQLEMHGIKVVLSNGVKGVSTSADGQTTVDLDSGTKLAADLVLLSIGVRPDTSLAKEAGIKLAPSGHVEVNEFHQTSDQDVYAVGDCVITKDGVVDNQMIAAALAGPANRQARLVADHIYAPQLAAGYPGSLGTAIIKVFDAAAGLTGWTEKRLARAKIPFRSTVVSGFGHASYYPGAQQLTVKLTWCPDTHRLLGGQVVGGMDSGVDKRLDVLATALRSKMTIQQLVHLELSYAPPFGNAKDVLNVAAFSAMNQIHGLIDPKPAIPEDPDIQVVDVRDTAVVEVKPLVHQSVNIPLSELRSRIHELDKTKPVITVCNVGKTSYFAARVLSQNGFSSVYSLQGGTSNHTDMCVHEPTPVVVEHKAPPSPTSAAAAESRGPVPPPIKLDCTGLSCPGPLLQIKKASDKLTAGQEMHVTASDPGFANDVKAFARTNGLDVLSVRTERGLVHAEVRKGGAPPTVASVVPAGFTAMGSAPSAPSETNKNAAIIVFSRDMDKVLASLVLANGACAMGGKTTMFFTFWGLAFLRKPASGGIMASFSANKSLLDKAMGYMLGAGFNLPLSSMHFGGMGPMMMNYQMTSKHLPTLESLLKNAKENNIRMIACTMSMDAMGIKKEELIDGVELGGVADFMAASYDSGLKLFI